MTGTWEAAAQCSFCLLQDDLQLAERSLLTLRACTRDSSALNAWLACFSC